MTDLLTYWENKSLLWLKQSTVEVSVRVWHSLSLLTVMCYVVPRYNAVCHQSNPTYLQPWPSNVSQIASTWTRELNIWLKAQSVLKLPVLSEHTHTHTHTHSTDRSTELGH